MGVAKATILGGRWDGHQVDYRGTVVEWKGDTYVALRTKRGRMYYLLESLADQWFIYHDAEQSS